jgi:hypothetical protein
MAWIELTAARLLDKTAELELVKDVLLTDDQDADDIIADELASTVKRVRGYCPTSTPLGEGSTIPDELEDAALALVRVKVFTRIKALSSFLSDARTKEAENAMTELRAWARGDFKVVPPVTESASQASSGSASEVIGTTRPVQASRANLSGLV